MTIICNVTGDERKRLAKALGDILLFEPVYAKAPTFAFVVNNYTIDRNGTIICPESASVEDAEEISEKLREEGFDPEIEGIESVDEDESDEGESSEDEASAEVPAEMPDVKPEAEDGDNPDPEETEAETGAETPDEAAPEEDSPARDDQTEETPNDEAKTQPDENQDEETPAEDDTKLTISIPREKLSNDALERLRIMVSNKEDLFKRALLADNLPIEVTEEEISFPWFTLTGTDGEAMAYTQFITALCQMAAEQKRVLDKPYDGDNDRFAMRIFMVRLGMKGGQFALARKLMMKHLTGNSGWRFEASSVNSRSGSPNRATVQHLKKAYLNDTCLKLVPMGDENDMDIQVGDYGKIVGVDDNGSVFIRLVSGTAFGISFATEQTDENKDADGSDLFAIPEDIASEIPFDAEPAEAPKTEEDARPEEDGSDTEEVTE